MTRGPARPIWLAAPSRYAGLGRTPGRLVAAALALLILASLASLWSAAPPPKSSEPATQADDQRDVVLYTNIVAAVRHGDGYYTSAARALRGGDYPLRPFFTFRLPTLAMVQGHLPEPVIVGLLFALVVAVVLAWAARLRTALTGRAPTVIALALLAGGLIAFVQADLWPFHEIWAGLLLALSLALRRPGRWAEAAAIGLIAALVRETAGLYLFLMMVLAWREGYRREALGWLAAGLALAAALAAHAYGVAQVTNPVDPASPGWAGLLGPGFFVTAIKASTALAILPLAAAAPLIALSLFGWAAWRDPTGLRAAVTFFAYAVLLAVFARPDTFYWGLMIAPAFLVGLIFVPDALRDLVGRRVDKPRITVTRVTR
ncbi:hypothetical protein AB2M62_04465 [Sphingomonas sp. MMS12-HWE2-04]|uniref:hypothetical protein n=1 Tax=Sphingomonas sp. MMS12-HWE2-04 TaxID=3234199 RepID=UPI00384B1328